MLALLVDENAVLRHLVVRVFNIDFVGVLVWPVAVQLLSKRNGQARLRSLLDAVLWQQKQEADLVEVLGAFGRVKCVGQRERAQRSFVHMHKEER